MKILSIETSGTICSVALSEGDFILSELSNADGNRHDELCAEYVRNLLNENNLSVNDLDAVAVSSGPGSFTGLRIGASLAKALCFKENEKDYAPKLISVPTLSSFANEVVNRLNFPKVRNFRKVDFSKIMVTIPAQKDVLYYQEFDAKGQEISEIKICQIDDFKSLDFNDTLLCGPQVEMIENLIAPPYRIEYSAKHIAKLAIKKFKAGEFTDASTYKPLYVQDFIVKKKINNI
jgi:tRNA threonylcarbamoyladenosine biosynthesis protein TsaB